MYKNSTCLLVLILASFNGFAQANNECSGAIPIALTPFGGAACTATIHATTAGATQSFPNPSCTSVENDDDIWYSFVPNTPSVLLRFSNVVNDVTGGAAYVGFTLTSGCPLNASTIICNNLVSAGSHFLIINNLTPGNVYVLRFWSTLTFGASASFDFCLQEVPAPPNDECANATVITSAPVGTVCNATYHGTTIGASPSAFPSACAGGFDDDDIWYTFTAHTSGVRINFSNAIVETEVSGSINIGYALYDVSCPDLSAVPVDCSPNIGIDHGSALAGGLVPGHQYYLRLFSYATNRYMSLDFCVVDVDLPLNDECRNAIPLTISDGFCTNAVTGNLTNATASAGFGPPACSNLSSSEDVWFKATVPASGNIYIQTSAVSTQVNDLVMEAYSGSCGALTLIACDDNGNPDPAPSDLHAAISLSGRIPGEIVYLRVLGKGVINWGPFAICAWDNTVRPPVSLGGACIPGNAVTINAANNNQYRWVPVFDAAGKIIAEVFGNGNALDDVSTSLFVNSSGAVRDATGLYYLDRNMTINTTGTGSARLRFYFTAGEWAALQGAQPAISLAALKIDKTSTACQPAFSGAATVINQDAVNGYGNDYFLEFTTPSFSSFYIEGTNASLPLRFVSFTGEARSGEAALQWIILRDEDISYFEVQKLNAAGGYYTLDQVKQSEIAADINGAWQYVFHDKRFTGSNSFYRIKMNTYSGAVLYSPVVMVRIHGASVRVAPNPVQDFITVTGSPGIESIRLIGAAGMVLKQYRHPVTQNGIVLLDVHGIPDGLYIVQVRQAGGGIQSFKIVKY